MKLKNTVLMATALSIGAGLLNNVTLAEEGNSASVKPLVIFTSKVLNKAADAMLAVEKDIKRLKKPLKVDYLSYAYFENGEVRASFGKPWPENLRKMIKCTVNIENLNNALPNDFKIAKSTPKGSLITTNYQFYGLATLRWTRSETFLSNESSNSGSELRRKKLPSASVTCETEQGVTPEIWKKMIAMSQEAVQVYEKSSAAIPRQFVTQGPRSFINGFVYMFDTEAEKPIVYNDNPADSEQ